MLSERFIEVAESLAAAEALFGEEVVFQLLRVMGSAMARVADAMVSAFLVNIEPATRGEDPVVSRSLAPTARRRRCFPA